MRLIPRDEKYFEMLNTFVGSIHKAADTFVKLFDDYANHVSYSEQIKAIEKECDDIAKTITDRLNSSFVTPIDREDIYTLAGELDDIIDMINDMARLTVLYNVTETTPQAGQLARILRDSVVELEKAFVAFEGRKDIRTFTEKIKRLEEDGDQASQAAIQGLFASPNDPLTVIKWLKIYEEMEAGIDRCRDVAKVLEAVVMKNA